MAQLINISVKTRTKLATTAPDSFKKLVAEAVQETMEMGEGRLTEQFSSRPRGVFLSVQQAQPGKATTGHYSRNINGVRRGLRARIDDSGVIYGSWLEIGRVGTRFKGYAVWRKTRQFLRKASKQIARSKVRKWIRMNGL